MNIIKSQNPEEINVHKQIWGKNAEEVIYPGRNNKYKVVQKTTRDVHFVILELRNLDIVRLW
jgi:hypothetical protein